MNKAVMLLVVPAGAGILVSGLIAAKVVLAPSKAQTITLTLDGGDTLDKLPAYDTLEEAAVHAEERAYKCSRVYECGGAIAVRPDGKYVVGPVQTSYHGDQVDLSHSVPAKWKLAGDYHTHPCLPDSHLPGYFSPQDAMNNTFLRVPGFIADLCTGKVHEFDPATMKSDAEYIESAGGYMTQGKIVGQIVVDGKSLEANTGL